MYTYSIFNIYIYIYVAVFSIYSYFPPLHILVGHGSTGMRILMAPVLFAQRLPAPVAGSVVLG